MPERKIINGEPCEQVESFDDLGPGLVVYVVGCYCKNIHRGMLIGPKIGWSYDTIRNLFLLNPNPVRCYQKDLPVYCINAGDVANGVIWRVIDGLRQDSAVEKKKSKEKV